MLPALHHSSTFPLWLGSKQSPLALSFRKVTSCTGRVSDTPQFTWSTGVSPPKTTSNAPAERFVSSLISKLVAVCQKCWLRATKTSHLQTGAPSLMDYRAAGSQWQQRLAAQQLQIKTAILCLLASFCCVVSLCFFVVFTRVLVIVLDILPHSLCVLLFTMLYTVLLFCIFVITWASFLWLFHFVTLNSDGNEHEWCLLVLTPPFTHPEHTKTLSSVICLVDGWWVIWTRELMS